MIQKDVLLSLKFKIKKLSTPTKNNLSKKKQLKIHTKIYQNVIKKSYQIKMILKLIKKY